MKKTSATVKDYFIAGIIFLPIFFYPPFVMTEIINEYLRIGFFLLVLTFLIFSSKRVSRQDVYFFILITMFGISMVIGNFSDIQGLRSSCNQLLLILFGFGLNRYLRYQHSQKITFIKLYIVMFTVIPVCALLAIICLRYLGEFNPFSLSSESYNYFFTPFGLLLDSHVPLEFPASFFFFTEPIYLAVIYVANIFFIAPFLNRYGKLLFILVNLLGGFLTNSYTFFILLPVIWALTHSKSFIKGVVAVSVVSICAILILKLDLLHGSSLSERQERMNGFFEFLGSSDYLELFFGYGFNKDTGFYKSFSAGILIAVFEIGVFNIAVITLIIFLLINNSASILLLFVFALLLFEPQKMPLFWMLMIISGYLLRRDSVMLGRSENLKKINPSKCAAL